MLTARVMAVLTLGVAPFVLFDVMTREYAGALLVVEPSCRVNALNKLTPLDVVINSCVDKSTTSISTMRGPLAAPAAARTSVDAVTAVPAAAATAADPASVEPVAAASELLSTTSAVGAGLSLIHISEPTRPY